MSPDPPQSSTSHRFTLRSVLVGVLFGLIATGIVLAQTSSGRSLLRQAHLSQPAQGFVQLYFAHPHALPDYVVSSRAQARVGFVVINDEHSVRSLHWAIATRGERSAVAGTVHLAAGARRTITRRVVIACTRRRVYEIVSIRSPRQSIGYWLSCPKVSTASRSTRTSHG